MTEPLHRSTPARAEELALLLATEVRERAALRDELLAAYRKQEAQLSRIILLEDVLSRRGVASYAVAKLLGRLVSGSAGGAGPRSAKARAKLLAKRIYRKLRGCTPGKPRAATGSAGPASARFEVLVKRAYRKLRRAAGRAARKAGLRK